MTCSPIMILFSPNSTFLGADPQNFYRTWVRSLVMIVSILTHSLTNSRLVDLMPVNIVLCCVHLARSIKLLPAGLTSYLFWKLTGKTSETQAFMFWQDSKNQSPNPCHKFSSWVGVEHFWCKLDDLLLTLLKLRFVHRTKHLTYRSYLGKKNSTLRSVVPLAMF